MGLINLFVLASIPVVKVLLLTATGLFLALDRVNILGDQSRNHLNKVVFYVFNPSLVAANLAKTITFESFLTLWFMPVNILITFIIGSALGWLLVKLTKAPNHLKGLIIGACSAGNMGNLPLILLPAMCKEKGSPFGPSDVCEIYALSYVSLSMAIGAVYLWSYVYNIVRISAAEIDAEKDTNKSSGIVNSNNNNNNNNNNNGDSNLESLLPHSCTDYHLVPSDEHQLISLGMKVKQWLTTLSEKLNLKAVLAPSIFAAMVGFAIGMISPIRNLMIGNDAPLHVVTDSAFMLGSVLFLNTSNSSLIKFYSYPRESQLNSLVKDLGGAEMDELKREPVIYSEAAIPCLTIILGANLLQGLKGGSGIQVREVIGILVARYIILPLLGILIVKGAIHIGAVPSHDKVLVFLLHIQYALPPAMNIGTITQLFGAGQSECSVIMLWAYALASISLTLWSTFFLWLIIT